MRFTTATDEVLQFVVTFSDLEFEVVNGIFSTSFCMRTIAKFYLQPSSRFDC